MKSIIAVLSESPFYFTLSLRDRHGLVKRLAAKEPGRHQELDLTHFASKLNEYLRVEND